MLPTLITAGAMCYVIAYLAFAFIQMTRAIPEQHRSPFGIYSIKYDYNYDTQRLAIWLKEHSHPNEAYLTQHPDMMDIMTQRNGHYLPLSTDTRQLFDLLTKNRIRYVLADKKNQKCKGTCSRPLRRTPISSIS